MPINKKDSVAGQKVSVVIARSRNNQHGGNFFGKPLEGRKHNGEPIFYMVANVEDDQEVTVRLANNKDITAPVGGTTATLCVLQSDYLALNEMNGQAFQVEGNFRVSINTIPGHPLEGQLFLDQVDYDQEIDVADAPQRVAALDEESVFKSLEASRKKNEDNLLSRLAERASNATSGALSQGAAHLGAVASQLMGKPVPTQETVEAKDIKVITEE